MSKLASSLPEEYERVTARTEVIPLEAERELFGATHADLGGYLMGLWGLPPAVVDAISLHHSPADSGGTEFSAVIAVHGARWSTCCCCSRPGCWASSTP